MRSYLGFHCSIFTRQYLLFASSAKNRCVAEEVNELVYPWKVERVPSG